jgi:hypothetical protein
MVSDLSTKELREPDRAAVEASVKREYPAEKLLTPDYFVQG